MRHTTIRGCLPVGFLGMVLLTISGCAASDNPADTDRASLRQQMVEEQLKPRGMQDARVLQALGKVPRHEFVPEELHAAAYRDGALPIGQKQAISQPYIVALMTEAIAPKPDQRVLAVGTDNGYQAAVLAELVQEVYTIELLPGLAEQAKERLKRLGYRNVQARAGDSYQGWPEAAPFDAVMVPCGAEHVPAPLFAQLKPGGVLIIPVGKVGAQVLRVLTKGPKGEQQSRDLAPVSFVPLRRADAVPRKPR